MTPPSASSLTRRTAAAVGVLAIAVLVVGLRYGTWVAGGSDSYGYVSQAKLWREGRALTPQPLPFRAPWPNPAWALSPLGYRPSIDGRGVIPTYPPGLPLTMALFTVLGGDKAVFVVVPLFGALAVWMTGRLGQRLGGAPLAVGGAALLAASPTFLYQLVQPMSDVPVTACWIAALVWAWDGGRRERIAAGVAVAVAILTRPNLAPLAAIVVTVAMSAPTWRQIRVRDGLVVAAPAALAILAIGYVQHRLYGSPFKSGYGSASFLYMASRVLPNLPRYLRWLAETHTPLILVGFAWPLFAWRLAPGPRAAAWSCWAAAVLVLALYLPYLEFDHWSYTRFLLPAIAVLWLLAGSLLASGAGASRLALHALVVTALLFQLYTGWSTGVYSLRTGEAHYPIVARVVRHLTPADAAVVTLQHSGTLRASRVTVRWDGISPWWLDRSIEYLQTHGRRPFLLVDDTERPAFIKRFGEASRYGRLDWAPLICISGTCLFDPGQVPSVTPQSAR